MLDSRLPVFARCVVAALVFAAIAGCGSQASSAHVAAAKSSPTTSASAPTLPAIVGRWSQVHTCPTLVHAYRISGLGKVAAYQTATFGPDLSHQGPTPAQVAARARRLEAGGNLCAGAHAPFQHSHFFDQSGLFGSVQSGQQVDNGKWMVQGRYLYIGRAKFRYRIVHDDRLTLTPIISPAQVRQALANPLKFTSAVWMVAVAYTGSVWHRVPCSNWC